MRTARFLPTLDIAVRAGVTSLAVLALTTATAIAARRSEAPPVGGRAQVSTRGWFTAPLPMFTGRVGSGDSLIGSAPTGNGPAFSAVDPATHTLYVTNGFNEDGNPDLGNTVSVIDTIRCQARNVSHCRGPWPTITVGNEPSSIAIDQKTDTVYVSNSDDNTVSVFNGATCNAEDTAGCGQTPATVPVGMLPVAIFADPANHTVYVPSGTENQVSLLNSATCNANDLAACPSTPPPTAPVAGNPIGGDVDPATHTVYVTVCGDADIGCSAGVNGISVFDANTCNATVQSGCGQLGALNSELPPFDAKVDSANETLYTANGDDTISAYDLRRCNASDLAGCATDTPGTVTFPGPGFDVALWVAVDPTLHSVYVTYLKDDSVIVVDTRVCNGSRPAGCATLSPPTIHTGADPQIVSLDPSTQTLYTANQVDNDVSVIDATRCSAQATSGCRYRAPEVAIGEGGTLTADPSVGTVYVPSGANAVSMINTGLCNAFDSRGCSQTPPTVTVGGSPNAVAVDRATHTVYVADGGSGSTGAVSLFDDRTCNATDQAGCRAVSTLQVPGGQPIDVAVNRRTDTIYVAAITSSGPNVIAVFDGATCNADDTVGCGQAPSRVMFADSGNGASSAGLAVDSATNTVYAINVVFPPFSAPFVGDSVYVINGAACDAANTTGCGQRPATVTLNPAPSNPFGFPGQEPNPFAVAVDQATDTIYTANLANGEGPGTVSVINGATCNGQNTTGCGQTPATAPATFGTVGIAVDQLTNRIYATNTEDTSVTVINGNICNGANERGCDYTRTQATVGDYPGSIALDPQVGTAYVQAFEGVSVIPLNP